MAFISWSDITPVQSNREKETENHKEWYVREKLLLNVKWLLVQQDYALKVHVAILVKTILPGTTWAAISRYKNNIDNLTYKQTYKKHSLKCRQIFHWKSFKKCWFLRSAVSDN